MDKYLSNVVLSCALIFILSGCGGSNGSVANPGINGQPSSSNEPLTIKSLQAITNGTDEAHQFSHWSCQNSDGSLFLGNFVFFSDGTGRLYDDDSFVDFSWRTIDSTTIEYEVFASDGKRVPKNMAILELTDLALQFSISDEWHLRNCSLVQLI